MESEVSVPPATPATATKPARRVPWGTVLSLGGTVLLTIGLVLLPIDFKQFGSASYGALFVAMLLSNATVILPAPGIGIAALAGKTLNPLLVGIVAGVAAGLGESTGWLAGKSSGELTHLEQRRVGRVIMRYVRRWGVLAVFVLAAIPSPLIDIAGITAGAMGMPWWKYVLACTAGKVIRFVIIAFTASGFAAPH